MKVAILIPGLIRHWEKTRELYIRFIKDIDADVFIATEPDQDLQDIPNIKSVIKKDYTDDFFSDGGYRTLGGPLQLEKVKDSLNLMRKYEDENDTKYNYIIRIRTDVIFNTFSFESTLCAFSSDMFHGPREIMLKTLEYFFIYRTQYYDTNDKLFPINLDALFGSHPFACRWLWLNFPSTLFKDVIEKLKDKNDEEKHVEFWKYISTLRDNKVDTTDEPVSFGKPDNKMPIEKYFALHVNMKNIKVKRQVANIIR